MEAQDVRVTIRVNRELKENAEALFDYLGLNMSNAVNIFLRKTVDQGGIPFPVNIGNQEGIKQKRGLPIARYDKESKRAFMENADGSREYV